MTDPSSNAAGEPNGNGAKVRIIGFFASLLAILISIWLYMIFYPDPFIEEVLSFEGSVEKGEKLFKVNCVGCHGIKAQGLLGPDLHSVSNRLSTSKIINQVIKGRTPPMPSFQIDAKSMSDLLSYLDSLD